ncbi:MAG: zinc-dependent peptidase [Planctomycetaceae bacterium]
MILQWFRRRRRRKIAARPFPDAWEGIIAANVVQYEWLDAADREKLRHATQIVVHEKNWEGCRGLVMTDEIRVTIAAQASFLLLGFDDYFFDRLLSILVYPDEYVAAETVRGPGGLQIETASARLGEAWHGGPVILSWPDVLHGAEFPDDGENVVLHEFAHVLDMHDADADGIPPLVSGEQYRTWEQVMSREYERLVRRAEHGRPTLLNHYGATSEAEFFAVATESFFEEPRDLQVEHPELYDVLKAFYRQDPAKRTPKRD